MQTKTYDPTLLEIAHRIRDMRDIAGFTAEEMAQKTGTTVAQYRSYERGESDFPFSFLHGFHDELCCAGGFSETVDSLAGVLGIIIPANITND